MLRVLLAILATGVLLAAACGGEDAPADAILPQAPAPIAQLIGPWQPRPFVLDPALRSRVEQACRRDMGLGPATIAAVVDVRGRAVAVVRMVGQGAGKCEALEIEAGGGITGAGGGWSGNGGGRLAPIEATKLAETEFGSVGGGNLKVQGWSVVGRAGPGIASVEIEPVGGPAVLATLENGWFAGWWPSNLPPNGLGGAGPEPEVVVRGYDAGGTQLDEVRP
jgi:hypothetical protein